MPTLEDAPGSSALIDAALIDLLSTISQFSDELFDSYWLELTEREVELLAVELIKSLARRLQGQTLKILLEKIRETNV